jgi:uncharacterized protein YjdB
VTVKNEDGTYTATLTVKVANEAPGITLENSFVELTEGENVTVNAQFVPLYPGDSTELIWSSNDETVAIVEGGKITAISAGECTVTAKNADGSFAATVSVKVLSKKVANENPGITLDKTEVTLKVGEEIFVDALFVPEYQGDNTALLWIGNEETVATVENGTIKAVGEGSCSVMVVNADGKYSAIVTVTVLPAEQENGGEGGEDPLPEDPEQTLPPEEEDPLPGTPEENEGDGTDL